MTIDETAPPTTLEKPGLPTRLRGAMRRLYRGETKFDFVRRKNRWFIFSSIIIAAGAISLGVRGLNFSIDFVGGTSWEVKAPATLSVTTVQTAVAAHGLSGATVVSLGSGTSREIQVEAKLSSSQAATSTPETNEISKVLAQLAGTTTGQVNVEQVGPSWGSLITHKAIEALIVFFIVIAIYISIFFEWKMALAAIIAVIHDIAVTAGIYSLTGFLVTPDTLVAFLTILGYSLYDTIVVFDRIRDNTKGLGATGKLSYTDVVNLSMNQTLARSINTSLVAILPILAVLVLGADILGAVTLQYFGLALLIGLTSGAYSSIFIASPLVAMIKEREPRYTSIREKLASRGTTQLLLTPAAVAAGALGGGEGANVRRRSQKGRAGGGGSGRAAPSGRLQPGAGRPRPATSPAAKRAAALTKSVPVDVDDEVFDDDELVEEEETPVAKPAARAGGAARSGQAAKRPAGSGGSASTAKRPPPRPRKKTKRR